MIFADGDKGTTFEILLGLRWWKVPKAKEQSCRPSGILGLRDQELHRGQARNRQGHGAAGTGKTGPAVYGTGKNKEHPTTGGRAKKDRNHRFGQFGKDQCGRLFHCHISRSF